MMKYYRSNSTASPLDSRIHKNKGRARLFMFYVVVTMFALMFVFNHMAPHFAP